MVNSFRNFTITGSPNGQNFTQEWPEYDGKFFLNFGKELSVSELSEELKENIKFWNEIVAEARLLQWEPTEKPILTLHSKSAIKRLLQNK